MQLVLERPAAFGEHREASGAELQQRRNTTQRLVLQGDRAVMNAAGRE
ncbi:hypothetical protein K3177_09380 [Qipengyuania sp. GH25]|uniref:Uncharacterized protein n=1 Tax=Qipengyuania pacifica TaxID=2860199 RepID=A0ABS7JFN5_9SPHN|nr:hypothetical protein [Qipengyuania aerophila]MBX7488726.1 hypothetical protein [Qipengyuania aerophila]